MARPMRETKASEYLADLFLDCFNNWLSTEAFAKHHNVPFQMMRELLSMGRELHEARVKRE